MPRQAAPEDLPIVARVIEEVRALRANAITGDEPLLRVHQLTLTLRSAVVDGRRRFTLVGLICASSREDLAIAAFLLGYVAHAVGAPMLPVGVAALGEPVEWTWFEPLEAGQ